MDLQPKPMSKAMKKADRDPVLTLGRVSGSGKALTDSLIYFGRGFPPAMFPDGPLLSVVNSGIQGFLCL